MIAEAKRSVKESDQQRAARVLLWNAVGAQRGPFDRTAVESWFQRHAAWVDPLLVDGLITGGTVNDPGRRHIPETEDVLFMRADRMFERYDPLRHGHWSRLGRVDVYHFGAAGVAHLTVNARRRWRHRPAV